jgi:hypothetical protein
MMQNNENLYISIYNGIESGKEEEWFFVLTLKFLAQTKLGPRKYL